MIARLLDRLCDGQDVSAFAAADIGRADKLAVVGRPKGVLKLSNQFPG